MKTSPKKKENHINSPDFQNSLVLFNDSVNTPDFDGL